MRCAARRRPDARNFGTLSSEIAIIVRQAKKGPVNDGPFLHQLFLLGRRRSRTVVFFLSGTRMRLCVTLANKSTSLRASVVSRSLGLVVHNLAPTEHSPERATWIKPFRLPRPANRSRELLPSLSGAGRNGSAGIRAQSGQNGDGYKQQPAQAFDGPWRSPSRKRRGARSRQVTPGCT